MADHDETLPLLPTGSVWALRPDMLAAIARARRSGVPTGKIATQSRGVDRGRGPVAVIPLTGILTPRGSLLSLLFGGGAGGLMEFRESFAEAVASPEVAAIVLDVDSPGGLVDLIPEAAAEVREARGEKRIVAVANTQMSSGAYWIAAQADEVVVTPSGSAGSIGVYMLHEDWSGSNEQMGVDPTYVYAGRFKVEGNPDEPLANETREHWQQDVDDLYAMFVEDVAAGRETTVEAVRSGYGEGRVLGATRAVEAGLADRVATFEATLAGMVTGGGGQASARALTGAQQPVAHVTEPPAPVDESGEGTEPADEPPARTAEQGAAIASILLA